MVFLREPLERLSMNEQMGDNLYKSEQWKAAYSTDQNLCSQDEKNQL